MRHRQPWAIAVIGALLTALVVGLGVPTASAATPPIGGAPSVRAFFSGFGPPTTVTPGNCGPAQMTFDDSGAGRGFVLCRADDGSVSLQFVSQSNGAFVREVVRNSQLFPVAVADDGLKTYALVESKSSTGRWRLQVVSRTRGGVVSVEPVAGGYRSFVYDVSMVAAQGGWWIAWTLPVPNCVCEAIWTARTMGTDQVAHDTLRRGHYPSLALAGSSAILSWNEGTRKDGGRLYYGFAKSTGFTRLVGPAVGFAPTMAMIDGYYRMAYTGDEDGRCFCVVYATLKNGRWVKTKIIDALLAKTKGPRVAFVKVRMAAGNSLVTIAWTSAVLAADGSIKAYYPAVAQFNYSTGTSEIVTDQTPPPAGTSDKGSMVVGLSSVKGRAYLTMQQQGDLTITVLRHQ